MMKRVAAALFALAAVGSVGAQKRLELTVDTIMRGPGLVGYEPSAPRWSGDSRRIYFEWKQASDPADAPLDTYVVDREGSGLRKLAEDEARLAPPAGGEESRDFRRVVYTRSGDVFLYDRTGGSTRRLTSTVDAETNPHFTRDGRRVWYTRSNNLFLHSLEDGAVEQVTDIRPAGSPPPPHEEKKGTESQEWVKKQERELLDAVRRRAERREREEARRKRENPRRPYILQARQTVSWLELSPDEKIVVANFSERAQDAKTTVVPNYVTESSYTETIPSRTMVGDARARSRMALIGTADGALKWVDTGLKSGSAERQVVLSRLEWSGDGEKAVMLARAADNKDRWVMALDTDAAKTTVLAADHDDAWVGGPGSNTLGWLPGDQEVYFQSERSGYSHLYAVPYRGGEPRALTSGGFEVQTVRLSRDKSKFYVATNEDDPGQVHWYSMPSAGGARIKLTRAPGHHRMFLSPDERWFADVHSYANRPPELFALENAPAAEARQLTTSPAPEFATYSWMDVPVVTFAARDGARVRARLYKPPKYRKNGPAVMFVHGAGYLQNVHRWWSSYYREYMFHHLLMERGYLVLDVDYRGSAGYGRDWRTAIYENMGGKDLTDHVDAAKWLVAEHGVDPKRIGLYGGSYGGFLTLMAMFREPGTFAAGAALRPVTDWSHYNEGYTGNILNAPQKSPDAYRRSSPIYFADGLKGALLICHGMVDVNVHFQDSVRLVQKLIELRKENWELAVYPVEDHAFVQPESWADEYKRILKLFETNLKKP